MNLSDMELYCFVFVLLIILTMSVLMLRRAPETGRGRYLWGLLIAISLVFLGSDEAQFKTLMQEDGAIEWASFYTFIAAGLLFFYRQWRYPRPIGILQSLSFIALGCFCWFVAGEEISWGQRLLGFKPPEIFLEHNFQQEANVHNFLTKKTLLGFSLDSKNLVALVAIIYGVLLPFLARFFPVVVQPFRASIADGHYAGFFLLVAWAEWAYPLSLSGEACEFYLGCLFLLSQSTPAKRGDHMLYASILILAISTAPLASRFIYGSAKENAQLAQTELQQLATDLKQKNVLRKRLLRKRSTHKRLYTAEKARHFKYPPQNLFLQGQNSALSESGRKDRLGYYLDPWNNPYWMRWNKRKKHIVLYSFGANRRRDLQFKLGTETQTDDIFVVIDLKKVNR